MPVIRIYSDELTHYGRLGMKWGQHIFGKDDTGSSIGKTKKKKSIKERIRSKREEKRQRARDMEAEKEIERRKIILSDPKLLNKHKHEFTTEEINTAIERFRTEKNLKAIANETHAERVKEIRKGYDYTKAIVDYTAVSMNAYNNFAKIYNTFTKEGEKRFPIIGEKPASLKQDDKKEEKKEDKA